MPNYFSNYDSTIIMIILILIVALSIFVYIRVSMFLNKLNLVIYGKKTIMAWLPFTDTYLLGKLTFGKICGWGLLIGSLLTGEVTLNNGLYQKTYSVFPTTVQHTYDILISIIIVSLYIYAHFKYKKLVKESSSQVSMSNEENYSSFYQETSNDNVSNNEEENFYTSSNQSGFYLNNVTVNENNPVENKNTLDNANNNGKIAKVNNQQEGSSLFTPIIQSVPKEEVKEEKTEDDTETL